MTAALQWLRPYQSQARILVPLPGALQAHCRQPWQPMAGESEQRYLLVGIATSSREDLRRRVDVIVCQGELSARESFRLVSSCFEASFEHLLETTWILYAHRQLLTSTRRSAALRELRPSFDAGDPPRSTQALDSTKPGAGDGPSVGSPPQPTVLPARGCFLFGFTDSHARPLVARARAHPQQLEMRGFTLRQPSHLRDPSPGRPTASSSRNSALLV